MLKQKKSITQKNEETPNEGHLHYIIDKRLNMDQFWIFHAFTFPLILYKTKRE